MANSHLKCKGCGEYHPREQIKAHPPGFCSDPCFAASNLARMEAQWAKARAKQAKDKKDREKAYNAETRKRKLKLKSRSDWLKEAQVQFNKFIRTRDKGKPCISCGGEPDDSNLITGSRIDAGHYRSTGSAPELRFEEINCASQCVKCNRFLSGSAVNYRIELISRVGIDQVRWLEGPHKPKRYTIEDLKEIKEKYKNKAKALEKELAL